MRKSPLSTPSGSRGRPSFGCKSNNFKSRTGYGSNNSDNYPCIPSNEIQMKHGGDFLPLNVSTPVSEQGKYSGNWHNQTGTGRNYRNSSSGKYNHYSNNYATPRSYFNNLYTPYKYTGKQYHGYKKAYQKDAHRHINISEYIDMKSFLEDPWAKLMEKLNNSKATSSTRSYETEPSLASDINSYKNPNWDYQDKSTTDLDDSQLSQESKNNSSLNTSLGLDDTDISELSKADSSIDLKLDTVTVSEGLQDDSEKAISETIIENVHETDNVHDSCNSEINIPRESI